MAERLNQLNEERRAIESEMQASALNFLSSLPLQKNSLPQGICLFDKNCHQGVIGILASRVKDRFHRPIIAFAPFNDKELKGSARSIQGVHIRDVLAELDTRYPHLITKFGGHAMAAGLVINKDNFEEFSKAFNKIISEKVDEELLNQAIVSDGELLQEELDLEVAEILREAGPWGQAFPEPVFDGTFKVLDQQLVGGKHLKMNLQKDDKIVEAIAFYVNLEQWPNYRCQKVNAAYRLDINAFRSKKKLQLIVEYLEEV
jgi:single-stranded-DNA-specific exonuclease